jgi:tRNA(Leu) C34 or U34 (ribose-2'-O)-methylase TrmL
MTESPSKSPRLSNSNVHPFEIVLFEPEIPLNVGSIARTCACSGCPLHLVGTLGFRLDDRLAKRAGLDYWEHTDVHVHKCWEDFKSDMDCLGGCWNRVGVSW